MHYRHLLPTCKAVTESGNLGGTIEGANAMDTLTWGYLELYTWAKLRENNDAHMNSYLAALQDAEALSRPQAT